MIRLRVFLCVAALVALCPASVYPPGVSDKDVPALLRSTEWVRGLDEQALVKLVPLQSGLNFCGCLNCKLGTQEGQIAWTPLHPDEVYCKFCNQRYPSDQYPTNGTLAVHNPRGEMQQYPYTADANGYRYFFLARRDFEIRAYLSVRTRELAQLYAVTGDRTYARRAAVILDRFAQVFPGWCYKYDYPFRQKEIYDGDVPPEKFRTNFRTSRWSWWAYMDVPLDLAQAYDWIRGSGVLADLSGEQGVDVAARIERDLFRNAGEQVLANREDNSNMSPTAWRSLVMLGRIIGEPHYVHEPVRRLLNFLRTFFLYDAFWPEGSPSYAAQTVGGLTNVINAARGYTDPPGFLDPLDGERFDNLDLESDAPIIRQANQALLKMRLPDGRAVPVHDTWSYQKTGPALAATQPFLLPGLGHAALGGGSGGEQSQLHLHWSGAYGHEHGDNLSLLLHARGREMLSDLGYTHTRYRAWTLATASHNTVVIDGISQAFRSKDNYTDGSLRWFDAASPRVQTVSADGERGYPGTADRYRRTLVWVNAAGELPYAADIFEVAGGRVHDYFLHGDADAPGTIDSGLSLNPLDTLLPAGMTWSPPANEGEAGRAHETWYGYGFLRHLRAADIPAGVPLPVSFRLPDASAPVLRVTLLPEAGSRLILGDNPSIRAAKEDDGKLDQFARPFLMLRHESADGHSTFMSLLEPYGDAPSQTSVDRLDVAAAAALRVQADGRTDLIVYEAPDAVTLSAGGVDATFQGRLGVLSLRGEQVAYAYALGGSWQRGDFHLDSGAAQSLPLRSVAADGFLLNGSLASLPPAGSIVRLLTSGGWCYPYSVTAAESAASGTRLHVAEGPGLEYNADAPRLRLTAFPQRAHDGPVTVEWIPSVFSGTAAAARRRK